MTLLADNPDVWDIVFRETGARVRFLEKLISDGGTHVLDVGCATGTLCASLRRRGARSFGLDLNPRFIEAARANDPGGEYRVGDMRSFGLGRRFDLLICVGTTFAYNLTNGDIAKTLSNFRAHLEPGGQLVIDVLNAIAFTGPRPFRLRTQHKFARNGFHATATIHHRLNLRTQTMTEQVSWKLKGQPVRSDPEESLRLFFPEELAFHLEVAGFHGVELFDSFVSTSGDFSGSRLIATATAPVMRAGKRTRGRDSTG